MFQKIIEFNFSITFDTIILILLGLTQHVHFKKKTIVQELGAHKLLIFYSLDYPTNVTPTLNNKKTPEIQYFAFKKKS